jgi:hypothetical protein
MIGSVLLLRDQRHRSASILLIIALSDKII